MLLSSVVRRPVLALVVRRIQYQPALALSRSRSLRGFAMRHASFRLPLAQLKVRLRGCTHYFGRQVRA
jgi:hypothetical protein